MTRTKPIDERRQSAEERAGEKIPMPQELKDNWVYATCPHCGEPAGHWKGEKLYCKSITCRFRRGVQ